MPQIGGGSVAVALPAGAKTPPETIFAVPGLERKMPTNDWWSSLAWMPYSERQYPHPLAVCAAANGLRVYYPGNRITANYPYTQVLRQGAMRTYVAYNVGLHERTVRFSDGVSVNVRSHEFAVKSNGVE